jgi:AAA family ATP:ADP antiporter
MYPSTGAHSRLCHNPDFMRTHDTHRNTSAEPVAPDATAEAGAPGPSGATTGHDVAVVFVLGYLLLASYAVVRPSTESMFLQAYGSRMLPWAWLAVALCASGAVAAYHRHASRTDLGTTFLGTLAFSALALLGIAIAHENQFRAAPFALYVWKDIYVVLLLELLWSFANVVFSLHAARRLYGLFCVCGSLGGISGNLATAYVAPTIGSAATLWLALPPLMLSGVIGVHLRARLQLQRGAEARGSTHMPRRVQDTVHMIQQSPYVAWMVLLVATVQTVVTLIDYQFNVGLELAYPDMDKRTTVVGELYALVDGCSLGLQFLTLPVLRFVGVPLTLLAVPLLLGSAVGAYALRPVFGLLALAKTASKALDYSLFRAAKEILYIPLSYTEKTLGKALVDVFTYRVAKAVASIALIAVASFQHGASRAAFDVTALILLLIAAWLWVTWTIVRRFRRMVSRHHELHVRPASR